jgi:integrase
MSLSSISNQVNHALKKVTWDHEKIQQYQTEHGLASVKKALRPNGDPTQPLPVILGVSTRRTYFQAATLFFKRAEEISGEGLLADLLDTNIISTTLEIHYSNAAPGTVFKILAAIDKVHLGCQKLGWVKQPSPITPDLRQWVKGLNDRYGVRASRFGYKPEDAARLLRYLDEKSSSYALPAQLARYCGLREDEIAGLKGENVDKTNKLLHITGKGGRYRAVPVSENLLSQLNTSKQYLFTPSASWRAGFRRVVGEAAKALGIEVSGVHRLRANYAQEKYQEFIDQGLTDYEARRRVSELLGHARVDVTFKYVPR